MVLCPEASSLTLVRSGELAQACEDQEQRQHGVAADFATVTTVGATVVAAVARGPCAWALAKQESRTKQEQEVQQHGRGISSLCLRDQHFACRGHRMPWSLPHKSAGLGKSLHLLNA